MKLFAVKFRRILEVFVLRGVWGKFWAQFHDLCVQYWGCFLGSLDAFWRFSPCQVYKKSFVRIFTIYVSKNEAVCREVQTYFGSSVPARFTEKVMGSFSRFVRSKTNLFAVKFRRILEALCLQSLQKKFWVHFHDLCVQIWGCFLRSSDAFRKFSPCEVYEKCSGHIITIFTSKNEAVCCEVQTAFGNFLRASFIKK